MVFDYLAIVSGSGAIFFSGENAHVIGRPG